MIEVIFDFETASPEDLPTVGADLYARPPTTHILSLTFTFLDSTYLWLPGSEDKLANSVLAQLAEDPAAIFICHNAGFEKAIWRHIMVVDYGFPDIPNERWHDIMAVCALKQVPLKLERALKAFGLPDKDKAASKFTNSLSRPNKHGEYKRDPATMQRVYDYNASDVRIEKALHRRVGWLPPDERRVWLLDQTINERGVRVDLSFVRCAMGVVERATVPLVQEFTAITGGIAPSNVGALKRWLAEQGVNLPDLRKETLAKLGLGEDDEDGGEGRSGHVLQDRLDTLPGNARRALAIRSLVGSSAIKKLPRMVQCVGPDGRARGLLQYHRAGPGRWAGRLFQPQNFPRGVLSKEHSHEEVHGSIRDGSGEGFTLADGTPANPIQVVASALRMALVPDDGKVFAVGDFSTIEARLVLALAGQSDRTALLASGADIYLDFCEIAQRPGERQDVGKPGVLSCGFGAGGDGLCRKKMAGCQCVYVTGPCQHSDSEANKTAQLCVNTYRKEWAPLVRKLWYALEKAAFDTVHKHKAHEVQGIGFEMVGKEWLTVRLLDGKRLFYLNPEIERLRMPWDADEKPIARDMVTYRAEKLGQMRRIPMYGSKWCQNIIEGLGRQLLVHAMFACEDAQMPVVLTVTDEIVCEIADEGLDYAAMLTDMMQDRPQWAIDIKCPVAAECWQGPRYRK